MLAPGDLQRIADVCLEIGNAVSEDSGFVPIRNLLARFGVGLTIRPLLVEGMLASIPSQRSDSSGTQWAVFIDSETFQVEGKEVTLESQDKPLPSRFRNTVAHELVHSLAFRPSEFGLKLQHSFETENDINKLVKEIERETERLSPLLLWPERSLAQLLSTRQKAISPTELLHLATKLGISRQVAITRLRLFRGDAKVLHSEWVRDVAVGMGEWEHQRAVVRKWPLFANFDRNIVPSFLHRIANQDRLPASAIFEDEKFAMCGGDYSTIAATVDAGIQDVPNAEQMQVTISMEEGSRKPGSEFFFVVRKRRPEDHEAAERQPQDT